MMFVWWCSGWLFLSMGANVLAMWWYSGCSFIVFGIEYIFALFLCVAGCVRRISGIGPGLGSISPHCNSVSLFMK